MSDLGDALQGVWNSLDMLGSIVRKIIRGKRSSIHHEWRNRDNGWVGVTTLLVITAFGFLVWGFLVM